MKYDIFISYSRKDSATADQICNAFDRVGITYFIDRQGIGGGVDFTKVIAEAILNSEKFLLLASKNSYASKFTTKEVLFAFNKKPSESILPYRIDTTPIPLELELVLADVNWREKSKHPIETTLVSDILALLGKSTNAQSTTDRPLQPRTTTLLEKIKNTLDSTKKYIEIAKGTPKYKIGDYYDDGVKQGIIFDLDHTGKHGKIISLAQTKDMWGSPISTGARSKFDGLSNQNQVMQIKMWDKKYPAFSWCKNLGEGWYLPAIEELKKCMENASIINQTLANLNADILFVTDNSNTWYWSSTEKSNNNAYYYGTDMGLNYDYYKNRIYYIRAIALI